MNKLEIKDMVIMIVAIISTITVFLNLRFRKKDFHIAILKEQISVYNDLIENLFETTLAINDFVKEKTGKFLIEKDFNHSDDELELMQTLLFVEFGKRYNESYNRFQINIILLPEDVIDAAQDYYEYISDLFENQNDHELSLKLLTELNQKVFDVINVIRNYIGIDTISKKNMKILAAGQKQLKFVEDIED